MKPFVYAQNFSVIYHNLSYLRFANMAYVFFIVCYVNCYPKF